MTEVTGTLIGGPWDGLIFPMHGFWLITPDNTTKSEYFAKEVLVPHDGRKVQPLWQDVPEAVLVPPRPPVPPYYHYRFDPTGDLEEAGFTYRYVGEWTWEY